MTVTSNPLVGRPAQTPVGRFGPAAQTIASPRVLPNALRMPVNPPAPVNPLTGALATQVSMAQMPQVEQMQGPEPQRSQQGIEDRVSTRIPTNAKQGFDAHDRQDLTVSHAAMQPTGAPGESPIVDQKYAAAIDDGLTRLGVLLRKPQSIRPLLFGE